MTDYAIETDNLNKVFPGGVVAVSALDLRVPRGVVYGLIGRNGAGKTTAIRLLMGLLRANFGSARVLGEDLRTASRETRARVAYVSQTQQVHAWMTVGELCAYASYFYEKWDTAYAQDLARRFDVPWDRQVGLTSGGQQRKVSILLALAARPDVLLLDEPAAGLDPIARRELVDEGVDGISRGDGCTVLFSTHIIGDLERLAEMVGVMDRGRMVMSARLEDLQTRTKRVQVIFEGASAPADFRVPGAVRSRTDGPVVTAVARLESDTQLDAIRSIPGARVNVFPLGLEDTFIELFGPTSRTEFTEELK
jgi:ABC-2 type transport system ATP-binding protein